MTARWKNYPKIKFLLHCYGLVFEDESSKDPLWGLIQEETIARVVSRDHSHAVVDFGEL